MNSTDNTALLTVLLAKHITSCNNVLVSGFSERILGSYIGGILQFNQNKNWGQDLCLEFSVKIRLVTRLK